MCERVKLAPLTAEEKVFAEEKYETLQWCIRNQRLSDDLADIAYLGYLHAVKKWYARPDLQQWSFRTIANQTIRSHVSNEVTKDKRRIQAISLDATIPGTEDLTYGSMVTYDHMHYLKGERIMSMKIDFDVKIPEAAKLGRTPNVEVETLVNFMSSKYMTVSMTYSDAREASNKAQNLRSWVKSNKMQGVNIYRMADVIYIEKVTAGRKKES